MTTVPSPQTIRKTFKYKLVPNKEQEHLLGRALSLCCELYNAALGERREAWRMRGITRTYYDQNRDLPALKQAIPELLTVHSVILQDVLRRVDHAFIFFYRRHARGEKGGYPRFKSVKRYHSFTCAGFGERGIRLDGVRLRIGKIGSIRVRWSRPLEGCVKNVTITQEPDGWYASFLCADIPMQPLPVTGRVIGLDLGLESFATLSTGEQIANPRVYRGAEMTIKRAHRARDRRQKGSRRRQKAATAICKHYLKVRRCRADFQNKFVHRLTLDYDTICREALQTQNIAQHKTLGKHVYDAGWARFCVALSYKAAETGRSVIAVPAAYTSATCSSCGRVQAMDLKTRVYSCPSCGLELHRDHNAALNILHKGMQSRAGQTRQAPT